MQIFRADRFKFADIAQALPHLLLPLDPLVFYYEINVDPTVPRKCQVYDIEIDTVSGRIRSCERLAVHELKL